jgi:hypothetical protein
MEKENQALEVSRKPIGHIADALAKAQAKIDPPQRNKTVKVRTKTGQEYTFDYADYAAIVAAVKGPLSENGIAWTHLIEKAGNGFILVTKLIHSSGEELEAIYPLPATYEPKDFGGAMTYGKRYCLSALTGCSADDDLDADPENTTDFKDRKKAEDKKAAEKRAKDAQDRIDQKATQAENMGEIQSIMDLIKTRMGTLTNGLGVAEKGKAMFDLLGVSKFEDLKTKSLEELKAKNFSLGKLVEENKLRQKPSFSLGE